MLSQLMAFWERFRNEGQKRQIILVLIIVLVSSNWYHYQTITQWRGRSDVQAIKIDELHRVINTDAVRYVSAISDYQAKSESCQNSRLQELKDRVKKDSAFYDQTDKLYQKINEVLILRNQ